ERRAIIADWRGPGNPGKTPRISTPNSSGLVPEETVRATPFIPGRKSSTANKRWSAASAVGAFFCAHAGADCAIKTNAKATTGKKYFFIESILKERRLPLFTILANITQIEPK